MVKGMARQNPCLAAQCPMRGITIKSLADGK
jgi:hypothetical protein